MFELICPLCRSALQTHDKTWLCMNGHAFDVSREGYVNLLPVQHKKSLSPGDTADSVAARRRFLSAGHYQPLRDAVARVLRGLSAQRMLDLGCGEGYYTEAMRGEVPLVSGLDIAKPAIQLAARQQKQVTWLVGSAALLPFADASLDVVSSLFSPLPVTEMHRVLKPNGHVLMVTPAPDHLWQVRKGLFEAVRAHEPDKFLQAFHDDFVLSNRQRVEAPLTLSQAALKDLLAMTPYAWKATAERRALLEANEIFQTLAAFDVMLFKRRLEQQSEVLV
jgi:23S rRNA (guanine745-N1)-methyltransferase